MNNGFLSMTRSLARPAHQAAKLTVGAVQQFEQEKDFYVQQQKDEIERIQQEAHLNTSGAMMDTLAHLTSTKWENVTPQLANRKSELL